MSKKDILLKEYEICQQEADASAANYWTFAGIYVGINTALLGAIAAGIVASDKVDSKLFYPPVWLFACAVFAFHYFVLAWLKRVTHLIGFINARMRIIETKLGMKKGRYIHGLDYWEKTNIQLRREIATTWEDLSEEEISDVEEAIEKGLKDKIPKKYQPKKIGSKIIPLFFWIIPAVWILIVLGTVYLFLSKFVFTFLPQW